MQDKILRDKKANDPWARMTTRNGFSEIGRAHV